MVGEAQESKGNPVNTLRSTPAVIWVILFLVTLLTLIVLLVPIVILLITKSPYVLPTSFCAILPGITLRNTCKRIVDAHYELNDRDYTIEEIKANRGIKRIWKYGDKHENKLSDP